MATFTLLDDRSNISETTMRVGGQKRLHLAGVGDKRDKLQIVSSNNAVAFGNLVSLFNGKKGIWTVDVRAVSIGKATIQAKVGTATVTELVLEVINKTVLPDLNTTPGLLARMYLAETMPPGDPLYDAANCKKGMRLMRQVLVNRLTEPKRFSAPGATTLLAIVKAKGQVHGFENYPSIADDVQKRIDDIVNIANNDNDSRQAAHLEYLTFALEVANEADGIKAVSPCATDVFGWRTADSKHPGGDFVICGAPVSGNQFYALKK